MGWVFEGIEREDQERKYSDRELVRRSIHRMKPYKRPIIISTITIMITTLTRFTAWFIEITNPAETNLISTLQYFYVFSIWGMRISILFAVFFLIVVIFNIFKGMGRKRWKDSWDNWGKE